MSMVEHKGQCDKDLFDDVNYAFSYVCVDTDAEVLPNSYQAHNDGSLIYMKGADTSWFGPQKILCNTSGRPLYTD